MSETSTLIGYAGRTINREVSGHSEIARPRVRPRWCRSRHNKPTPAYQR
jgi:hypothetical protein